MKIGQTDDTCLSFKNFLVVSKGCAHVFQVMLSLFFTGLDFPSWNTTTLIGNTALECVAKATLRKNHRTKKDGTAN